MKLRQNWENKDTNKTCLDKYSYVLQKITPFLWFSAEAEEAMRFYVDTFASVPDQAAESKIASIRRYPDRTGRVMQAMLKMKKIIIADLEAVAEQ